VPDSNPPERKTIEDLIAVMAALRTPGSGCPWDLEQTFETIAPYTIEEAYEVADAIERAATSELKDELGDLLFQVVYHARMAEETGAFDFADVVDAIVRKMIRRHPHVFGTDAERRAGVTKGFWERAKAKERAESRSGDAQPSVLDGVTLGLPALTRAVKLQNKAARVGFDWPSMAPVFGKVREELAELEAAIGGAQSSIEHADAAQRAHIEEEFGDLLFVMANVARWLSIDPEQALRAANAKFVRRFRHIEARLAEAGRSPSQSTLDEMDRLWDEAKSQEHGT
jgi:ATP diphosphatase